MVADGASAEREFLPQLEMDNPERQRRLTVAFRVILLIPQFIIVWGLSIAAGVVTFIGWWAALVLGRLPDWVADFLSGYLAWTIRVSAYGRLAVDEYPPFQWAPPNAAVRIELQRGELNRWAVLFRIILAIPAAILYAVLTYGWGAASFVCWLVVLIMGRTPVPLFGATAAVVRYELRYQAYWMMLTSAYPKGLFGDGPTAEAEPRRDTRPFRLTDGGRWVLIIFIVLGVLSIAGNAVNSSQMSRHGQEYGAQP